MSAILTQIYSDILDGDTYIEMESLNINSIASLVPWTDLKPEHKKKYILDYMRRNTIEGEISLYTFKDISFNKEERQITKLTYYRKGNNLQKTKKL